MNNEFDYLEEYNWSVITLKLAELLKLEFGIEKTPKILLQIESNLEDYELEKVKSGAIIDFLNLIISGEEHSEAVIIPNKEQDEFLVFEAVLSELEDDFNLAIYNHGEWLLWHLPNVGYGVYVQHEATPNYYWTDKKLLDMPFQELIDSYSFKKR